MTLKGRIERLEREAKPTPKRCTCGVVGAIVLEGEGPGPTPSRCPKCGGVMDTLQVAVRVIKPKDESA